MVRKALVLGRARNENFSIRICDWAEGAVASRVYLVLLWVGL